MTWQRVARRVPFGGSERRDSHESARGSLLYNKPLHLTAAGLRFSSGLVLRGAW
jgi:hypothetical protein